MWVSKTRDRGSIPRTPAKLRPASRWFLLGYDLLGRITINEHSESDRAFEDQDSAQKFISSGAVERILGILRIRIELLL